ncbi:hypothetical protein AB9M10_15530 [Rhodococcus erythropolis]
MNDANDPRSLLFLSCDLVGSTQFKQAGGDWQRAFVSFYRQFPQVLEEELQVKKDEYQTRPPRNERPVSISPKLWKPIGDELVYTVHVTDEFQIYDAVNIWISALDRYEETMLKSTTTMGTKGGAFLATFPGPDEVVSIPKIPKPKTPISIQRS